MLMPLFRQSDLRQSRKIDLFVANADGDRIQGDLPGPRALKELLRGAPQLMLGQRVGRARDGLPRRGVALEQRQRRARVVQH
jgi:hypothetical protein